MQRHIIVTRKPKIYNFSIIILHILRNKNENYCRITFISNIKLRIKWIHMFAFRCLSKLSRLNMTVLQCTLTSKPKAYTLLTILLGHVQGTARDLICEEGGDETESIVLLQWSKLKMYIIPKNFGGSCALIASPFTTPLVI